MKIMVIGANGQLGSDLVQILKKEGNEVVPLDHQSSGEEYLDIEKYDKVEEKINYHAPNVVINTSAFHDVDLCEVEKEKNLSVNVYSVRNLAELCSRKDIVFVHISTDYVFDGKKGSAYTEEDIPNPLSVYGAGKLEGEKAVRNIVKHFLIRTSYLYGEAGKKEGKSNLVETLLKYGRKGEISAVYDNKISPTNTKDLAEKISELLRTNDFGLYHLTNSGECSVEEFANEIFRIEEISPVIKRTSHSEFSSSPGRAQRPLYSPLISINLKKTGLSEMRPWQTALADYLKGNNMEGIKELEIDEELKINLDVNAKIAADNSKIINGVELVKRTTHSDDRGHLTEIYRIDEPYHEKYGGPLRQVYFVENDVRGTTRAFHKHKELWDFFSISNGSAKFILIDDRPGSETFGAMNVFVLNSRNKSLLVIPPGVFHGWMSLTDNTQMLSIASHTYNREKPDEARIPPESFGAEWEVKGR